MAIPGYWSSNDAHERILSYGSVEAILLVAMVIWEFLFMEDHMESWRGEHQCLQWTHEFSTQSLFWENKTYIEGQDEKQRKTEFSGRSWVVLPLKRQSLWDFLEPSWQIAPLTHPSGDLEIPGLLPSQGHRQEQQKGCSAYTEGRAMSSRDTTMRAKTRLHCEDKKMDRSSGSDLNPTVLLIDYPYGKVIDSFQTSVSSSVEKKNNSHMRVKWDSACQVLGAWPTPQ